MSGSSHFAKMARKIIYEEDRGAKSREERYRARQLMQEQMMREKEAERERQQEEQLQNLALNMGFKRTSDVKEQKDSDEEKADDETKLKKGSEMACACGELCNFSIILANISRVLWVAYEEYELLHACYSELFYDLRRCDLDSRVAAYWRTFVLNAKPTKPHRHAFDLMELSIKEREAHQAEKAKMPVDPVAPLRRSLLGFLLNPFGCVKCRCIHCAYLDAVLDYRVALFSLLAEYCQLFEDYARLIWSSKAEEGDGSKELVLQTTSTDRKMFKLTMSELHSAMSFFGDTDNVMKGLEVMQALIFR